MCTSTTSFPLISGFLGGGHIRVEIINPDNPVVNRAHEHQMGSEYRKFPSADGVIVVPLHRAERDVTFIGEV